MGECGYHRTAHGAGHDLHHLLSFLLKGHVGHDLFAKQFFTFKHMGQLVEDTGEEAAFEVLFAYFSENSVTNEVV